MGAEIHAAPRRMRILLTADPGLPVPPELYGGIERIVAALIAGCRQRGHEVGLVATAGSTAAVDAFAPWPEARPQGRLAHVKNSLHLAAMAGDFAPDILHSYSRLGYMMPLLPRRLAKMMSYQRVVGARQVKLAGLLSRGTLSFTGCSDYICSLGRRGGGAWHSIPNFVELETFPFVAAVPADAPLVFLSRIESIKGPDVAIEIARRAGRRLIIAGNTIDSGPERDFWEQKIKPQIGRDGIEYAGPVNDAQKAALLGGAAAMLVPIQWDEPFGIVFAEALACGTPVISSPRGALPEIVEEGATGFLVRDVAGGVEAVSRLAQIDRAACRRSAEERFSLGVVCERYLAAYGETLDRIR